MIKEILQKIIDPEQLDVPYCEDSFIAEYISVNLDPEQLKMNNLTKIIQRLLFNAGKILTYEEEKLVKIHLEKEYGQIIEYLNDSIWGLMRAGFIDKKITEEEVQLIKDHLVQLNERKLSIKS